jgi:hypothetical protein
MTHQIKVKRGFSDFGYRSPSTLCLQQVQPVLKEQAVCPMATSSSTPFPAPPGLDALSATEQDMTQPSTRIRYHKKEFWDVFTKMGHASRQRPAGFAEDLSCVTDSADDMVTQWRSTRMLLQVTPGMAGVKDWVLFRSSCCSLTVLVQYWDWHAMQTTRPPALPQIQVLLVVCCMQDDDVTKFTSAKPASSDSGYMASQNLPAQGIQSHLNSVPHSAALAAAMAVLPSPVHAANAAALAVKALAQIRVSAGASQQRSYKPPVCSSGLASTTAPCMMPLAGSSSSSRYPAAANVSTPSAASSGDSSTPTGTSSWHDSWSGQQHPSMAPPSLNCVPPATCTSGMQPGDAQWEEAVKRLLGFHNSQHAAAAWFVQAPRITGKSV